MKQVMAKKKRRRSQRVCNLSPTLFNSYIEKGLKEKREENFRGIKIGPWTSVQIMCFANDIAVIFKHEEDLNNT